MNGSESTSCKKNKKKLDFCRTFLLSLRTISRKKKIFDIYKNMKVTTTYRWSWRSSSSSSKRTSGPASILS